MEGGVIVAVLESVREPLQQYLQEEAYCYEQRGVLVIMVYVFRNEVHERDAQQKCSGKSQQQGSTLLVPPF